MKSFYKEWLRKSNEENKEVLEKTNLPSTSQQVKPSTSQQNQPLTGSIASVTPSTSKDNGSPNKNNSNPAAANENNSNPPPDTIDVFFEKNNLQLLIEKAAFLRQKRFKFQDHLFHVKIKLKDEKTPIPFLKDILDFLHEGLLFLMQKLKKQYNEKDENICYLTLHQNPMVIGLNSGVLNQFFL